MQRGILGVLQTEPDVGFDLQIYLNQRNVKQPVDVIGNVDLLVSCLLLYTVILRFLIPGSLQHHALNNLQV